MNLFGAGVICGLAKKAIEAIIGLLGSWYAGQIEIWHARNQPRKASIIKLENDWHTKLTISCEFGVNLITAMNGTVAVWAAAPSSITTFTAPTISCYTKASMIDMTEQ